MTQAAATSSAQDASEAKHKGWRSPSRNSARNGGDYMGFKAIMEEITTSELPVRRKRARACV